MSGMENKNFSSHYFIFSEIAWLCPGKVAAQFRRKGAEVLCRALAGDLSLVEQIVKRHQSIEDREREALASLFHNFNSTLAPPMDLHQK